MEEFESVEEIAEMPLDKLVDFLVMHGKNRFDDPQDVAKALQKAARSSYRLPQSAADSINLAMASSIRVIRVIQEQLKSLKKAIEDHLKAIPQTLDSVPGIGPIFASAEQKVYADKRALALTARKLVRLVDYLLRTNRLYESKGGILQID